MKGISRMWDSVRSMVMPVDKPRRWQIVEEERFVRTYVIDAESREAAESGYDFGELVDVVSEVQIVEVEEL